MQSSKNVHYDKATEQLNESDLESQMDDYMIKSVTESSSDTSKQQSEMTESESEESEDSFGEKVDPHNVVLEKMESFYDKNYKTFSVCNNSNVMDEKVWSIFYDDKYDFVYVFLAKVNQIKGNRIIKKEHNVFNMYVDAAKSPEPTPFNTQDDGNMMISNSEKPFIYYSNCLVQIDLVLQVWNVDDRIMRDKDHRQRAMATRVVLEKIQTIDHQMNTFQHMAFFQKKYQHLAQIVESDSKIHFFTADKSVVTFNTQQKRFSTGRLKCNHTYSADNVKCVQNYLHYKEAGTPGQGIESLLQFKLVITEKQKDDKSPLMISQKQELGYSSRKLRFKAQLVLNTINYKDMAEKQNHDKVRSIKQQESSIAIKDDNLLNYYMDSFLDSKQQSFFIQRLMYSNTYLIIFPTGILMLVNTNPFVLIHENQLNMKKDERIIDYCYCISDCYKKHCVWLMDEKLQIWKCVNEMNPTSFNWNLSKYQTFETLYYRRFLRPAMTYSDFYPQTILNKLKAMNKVLEQDCEDSKNMLIAYNGTTTKAIIVTQPDFNKEEKKTPDADSIEARSQLNIFEQIKKNSGQINQLPNYQGLSIKISLISKKQNIILNQIMKTSTLTSNLQQALNDKISKQANLIRKQKFQTNQMEDMMHGDFQKMIKSGSQYEELDIREQLIHDNEIQELVFMGKVDKSLVDFKGSTSEKHHYLRQYIIRRKRTLETMVTNGLSFQTNGIPSSLVQPPMSIYDVVLSQDKQKLITFIADEQGNNAEYRTFRLSHGKKFEQYQDEQSKEITNPKNVKMDQSGQLYQVQIELVRSTKSKRKPYEYLQVEKYTHLLKIHIPECILMDDIADEGGTFERVVLSADGRLVMCGKTVIQLSKNKDDIDAIGCFMYEKDSSNNIVYQFLSLVEDKEKITSLLKKKRKRIIEFDPSNPPISPDEKPHVMYMTNCFDEQTGDTSLMKIKSNNLECYEIYQSNYRVQNLSMNEQKNDQDFLSDPEGNGQGGRNSSVSWDRTDPSPLGVPLSGSMIWNQSDVKKLQQGKGKKKHSKIHKKVYLSLLSQTKNQINIEIVSDPNIDNPIEDEKQVNSDSDISMDEREKTKAKKRRENFAQQVTSKISGALNLNPLSKATPLLQKLTAQLEKFLSIQIREELQLGSEIGWINMNQMILTLNNDLYLMNLKHQDLKKVKNGLQYGIQQVSMGLFCSIVKKYSPRFCPIHSWDTDKERELIRLNHKREQKIIKNQITESQKSILRMEIASLKRYVFLRQAFLSENETKKSLLFFTPTEELHGSNIFSKVSSKIRIMQPYLDQIDIDFINLMNANVQNIMMYVNQKFVIVNNLKLNIDMLDLDKVAKQVVDRSGTTSNEQSEIDKLSQVHMYQKDISGLSVIDYAFEKKAIFCIKAFVETLLILSNNEENQFRNCFDKAILLMIEKGMDVKELVNSELFYPQIWQNKSIFSAHQDAKIVPYNGDLDDLEFKDPQYVFAEIDGKKNVAEEKDDDDSSLILSSSVRKIKNMDPLKLRQQQTKERQNSEYEMKFNYIFMKELENDDKTSVSRTLQDCHDDIEIFRQDVIRHIIDYKWETYGRNFQLAKFFLYTIFLFMYMLDLQSIQQGTSKDDYSGVRVKEWHFYLIKGVCVLIQLVFLIYEMYQFYIDRLDYFYDAWNYLEIGCLVSYFWGAYLDIIHEIVVDENRIVFVFSVMFSLIKFVYLVRVFKSLNSLVKMISTVVQEVMYFMILFLFFLFTFAECNQILQVDISAYGRTPSFISHVIAVLRRSMGDFSLIDPKQTFDIFEVDENGTQIYRHSYKIMMFTWLIYAISVFFLFMIFMNFIIAVISDSYTKVYSYKDEYDYLQRCTMNYEREKTFGPEYLASKDYFPDVLIIRAKKDNDSQNNSLQTWMINLKAQIKSQAASYIETLSVKSKEQKQHFSNSINNLKSDIKGLSNGLENIFTEIKKITDSTQVSDSSFTESDQDDEVVQDGAKQEKGRRKSKLNSGVSPGKSKKANILINNMMDQQPTRQSPVNKSPKRSPSQQPAKKTMTMPPQEVRKSSVDDSVMYQTNENRVSSAEFKQLKEMIHNKFQDMDTQMQMLMEMQKQNQEYTKSVIRTQNLCYHENEKNFKGMYKKMAQDLSDFKLQSQQMIPAPQPGTDYMSLRGQEVMNQLRSNHGNLPMSRVQADYPKSPSQGIGYKGKKKRDQQPLIISFHGSADEDDYEQRGRSRSPPQRLKSTNTVNRKYLNMESNEESEFEGMRQRSKDKKKKKY